MHYEEFFRQINYDYINKYRAVTKQISRPNASIFLDFGYDWNFMIILFKFLQKKKKKKKKKNIMSVNLLLRTIKYYVFRAENWIIKYHTYRNEKKSTHSDKIFITTVAISLSMKKVRFILIWTASHCVLCDRFEAFYWTSFNFYGNDALSTEHPSASGLSRTDTHLLERALKIV